MKQKQSVLIIVLLILILMGVMADIIITVRTAPSTPAKPSLPCAAIPTRYVLEYPECADRLLRAMNVTNVRILPRGSLSDLVGNRTRSRLR